MKARTEVSDIRFVPVGPSCLGGIGKEQERSVPAVRLEHDLARPGKLKHSVSALNLGRHSSRLRQDLQPLQRPHRGDLHWCRAGQVKGAEPVGATVRGHVTRVPGVRLVNGYRTARDGHDIRGVFRSACGDGGDCMRHIGKEPAYRQEEQGFPGGHSQPRPGIASGVPCLAPHPTEKQGKGDHQGDGELHRFGTPEMGCHGVPKGMIPQRHASERGEGESEDGR
jgi:hypothetical protein